jgi:10 TM Acyl Transferase domain found in Cas1p
MFSEMGATTIMMCLFFGVNTFLHILFQLVKRGSNQAVDEKKLQTKELSKPFNGTLDCFTNLTSELFRTGLIMTLTYVCEKHPLFEHSQKSYSRDFFLFVLVIFFGYAFMTIKPVHDLTLLGIRNLYF